MRTSQGLAIAVGAWFGIAVPLGLHPGGSSFATGQVNQTSDSRKSLARRIFRMSEAIVCSSIEGYEDYEPLPGAAMTADEKLLIYYRPLNYRSSLEKGWYQAHLIQDGEIRKRGAKKFIRQKLKVLDYTTPKTERPPELIYLRNTISLKGLEPGEYDFVITLRDEVAKGERPRGKSSSSGSSRHDDPHSPDKENKANTRPNDDRARKGPRKRSRRARRIPPRPGIRSLRRVEPAGGWNDRGTPGGCTGREAGKKSIQNRNFKIQNECKPCLSTVLRSLNIELWNVLSDFFPKLTAGWAPAHPEDPHRQTGVAGRCLEVLRPQGISDLEVAGSRGRGGFEGVRGTRHRPKKSTQWGKCESADGACHAT